MNKNYYIAPDIRDLACEEEQMVCASRLGNPSDDSQSVTVTDDEYNGEFRSRRSIWGDDED